MAQRRTLWNAKQGMLDQFYIFLLPATIQARLWTTVWQLVNTVTLQDPSVSDMQTVRASSKVAVELGGPGLRLFTNVQLSRFVHHIWKQLSLQIY